MRKVEVQTSPIYLFLQSKVLIYLRLVENMTWKRGLWVPYSLIGAECNVPGTNLYLKSNGDVQVCAGGTRSYGNYFITTPVAQMMDSQFFKDVADNYKGCHWVEETI